jgi:hypothetical protein
LNRRFVGIILVTVPCIGAAAAGCGLDKQGELVADGAGPSSSGLSASSSGSSGGGGGSGGRDGSGSNSSSSSSNSSGSSSGTPGGTSGGSGGDDSSTSVTEGGPISPPDGSDNDAGDSDAVAGPDGGPSTCDFSGAWGTKVTIPVNWIPQGLTGVILAPGSGVIQQWIRSTRTVTGTASTDTAVVCGIALPDFSGTSFVGGETYGVRFPDSLFDSGYLPPFVINGTLADNSPTTTFSTKAAAVLIGLTLASPTTTSWPATVTTAVDTDKDGNPGVTVNAATGPIPGRDSGTYSPFAVDVLSDRANQLFLVIRQVTQLTGAAVDCDHLSGTTTIPKIPNTSSGKYAIDSHIMGCNLIAGGTCSSSQTTFIDDTQPVFSPSGSATFTSVRMKSGATCSDVRTMFP